MYQPPENQGSLVIALGATSDVFGGLRSSVDQAIRELGLTLAWKSRGFWRGRPAYAPGELHPYALNSVLIGTVSGNQLSPNAQPGLQNRCRSLTYYYELVWLTEQQVERLKSNVPYLVAVIEP